MDRPPVIKLLTLGDSGSGKSSLLLRYTDDEFSDEFVTTIGMDFKFKRVLIQDKPVKVQIWDTAGQERFRTITQNYYRGAHGILFVCSVDDQNSKNNIKRWMEDVRKIIKGENFNSVLVFNKIDILAKPEDIEKEAQDIADELGINHVLTSAKENIGVDEAFTTLIELVYERLYGLNSVQQSQFPLNSTQQQSKKGWLNNIFGSKSNTNDQQQLLNDNDNDNSRNEHSNSSCC